MVDDGIYTKNADIQALAGVNANATSKATAATDIYVLTVESAINVITRYNWTDAFTAGLNADVGGILTETGACFCAIKVITSDMDAIGRSAAESMITVLRDTANRNLQILRDIKNQTFIKNA